MYNLPVPSTTSMEAYNAAVQTIRDIVRRTAFKDAAPIVQAQSEVFDKLASELRLSDAYAVNFEVSGLGSKEMTDLYDRQFAKREGTKAIRDSIKNAAPHDLCPYCGEGSVAQLDHYLPKAKFAATTVYPANLVPACGDCNYAKLEYAPGDARPAVLHPYFDRAFDIPWLSAQLKQSQSGFPVIDFEVQLERPDAELELRLKAHMNVFKLWRRFGTWAAQSLNNFERLVQKDGITINVAQEHLERMKTQESGGRTNSWEGATYQAMLASDWYLRSYLKLPDA